MEFSSVNTGPLKSQPPYPQGTKRPYIEPIPQPIIASIGESGSNPHSANNLQDRDISRPKKMARTSNESVGPTENNEPSSEFESTTNNFLELEKKIKALANRHMKLAQEESYVDTTALTQSLQKSLEDLIKVSQLVQYMGDLAQKDWLSSSDIHIGPRLVEKGFPPTLCQEGGIPEIISKVQEAIDGQVVSKNVIATVIHKCLEFTLNENILTKYASSPEDDYPEDILKILELCKPFIPQGYLLAEDEEIFKDFTITFEKEEEAVFPNYMKKILAASSPYFKAMFTHNFAEAQQKNIVINDSKEQFVVFLDYFNGNHSYFDSENIDQRFDIARLAQKYDFQFILDHFFKSIQILIESKMEDTEESFDVISQIYKNMRFLQMKIGNKLQFQFSEYFGAHLVSRKSPDSVMEAIKTFNEDNISSITVSQISINQPLQLLFKHYTALRRLNITFAHNDDMCSLIGMTGLKCLKITVNPDLFNDNGLICLRGIPLISLIIENAKNLTPNAYNILQDMPLTHLSMGSHGPMFTQNDQFLIDDSTLVNLQKAPLKFLFLKSRNIQITENGLALLQDTPLESLNLANCRNLSEFSFEKLKFRSLKYYSYWYKQRQTDGSLIFVNKKEGKIPL